MLRLAGACRVYCLFVVVGLDNRLVDHCAIAQLAVGVVSRFHCPCANRLDGALPCRRLSCALVAFRQAPADCRGGELRIRGTAWTTRQTKKLCAEQRLPCDIVSGQLALRHRRRRRTPLLLRQFAAPLLSSADRLRQKTRLKTCIATSLSQPRVFAYSTFPRAAFLDTVCSNPPTSPSFHQSPSRAASTTAFSSAP